MTDEERTQKEIERIKAALCEEFAPVISAFCETLQPCMQSLAEAIRPVFERACELMKEINAPLEADRIPVFYDEDPEAPYMEETWAQIFRCSRCGGANYDFSFCPHCGAKMKKPEAKQ